MFVNKYTIPESQFSGTTGYSINIPMTQNGGFLGQEEIVNSKFVEVEVDKAVNVIFDYEKVKLLPRYSTAPNVHHLSSDITYKVSLLTTPSPSTTYNTSLTWSNIGFTNNDFKFRKNSFVKSFLRLDFYDSDIATNQNHISFITLYPKFSHSDVLFGLPLANAYSVSFTIGNPIIDRKKHGEGFALYHFKDEIVPTVPTYLYMKATFNNAKTGKSTGLMSSSGATIPIDTLMQTTKDILPVGTVVNKLYTRYILTRDSDGYFYELDRKYSDNIRPVILGPTSIIHLFEISTI